MVLDVPETEEEANADEELENGIGLANGDPLEAKGLGRLHISQMLQSVLQDAQTRLFFKAQSVVQSDIRYYVPKPDDTDYPAILGLKFYALCCQFQVN